MHALATAQQKTTRHVRSNVRPFAKDHRQRELALEETLTACYDCQDRFCSRVVVTVCPRDERAITVNNKALFTHTAWPPSGLPTRFAIIVEYQCQHNV